MSVTRDRRSESRQRTEVEGILSTPGPQSLTIPCRLTEVSDHGFRAAHDCAALIAGTQVTAESPLVGKVTARVIWTAIMGNHIESGFYILS
jgi:hypothetical protein